MSTALLSSMAAADPAFLGRVGARVMIGTFVFLVLCLIFVPWQQSVRGYGRVIAYAPLERTQAIQAPIFGRVIHWYVQEGQRVAEGDLIAQLADNDPDIMIRLERQRVALDSQIEAAKLAVANAELRVAALTGSREAAIEQAERRLDTATQRVQAAEQTLDAAEANERVAALNLARTERLHAKGLASERELELAQGGAQTTRANVGAARETLSAIRQEVRGNAADIERIAATEAANIEAGRSALQSAIANQSKIEGELANLETQLSRQNTMTIMAPRAGTILRFLVQQGGAFVKAGEPVVTFVPDGTARAVELWLDGNDAPLVTPNREVRLQFEGWPAVQFVGWPSVAVGTFGGVVDFVDATDDGTGRFRVVIIPAENEDWPATHYLRQGVRTNGWVLLNRVTLGFELWRQLNAFPPSIPEPDMFRSPGEAGPGRPAIGVRPK